MVLIIVDKDAGIKGNVAIGGNQDLVGHLSIQGGVGKGVGAAEELAVADNGWGEMVNSECPHNTFMCGVRVRNDSRVDDDGRSGRYDNAGINGMWLKCCPFK